MVLIYSPSFSNISSEHLVEFIFSNGQQAASIQQEFEERQRMYDPPSRTGVLLFIQRGARNTFHTSISDYTSILHTSILYTSILYISSISEYTSLSMVANQAARRFLHATGMTLGMYELLTPTPCFPESPTPSEMLGEP